MLITEDCVEDFSRTCVENKCVKKCTSTASCGKGFSCTYIDQERPSLGKECRPATDDTPGGEVDDRFGCNCGECCTQAGSVRRASALTTANAKTAAIAKKASVPG